MNKTLTKTFEEMLKRQYPEKDQAEIYHVAGELIQAVREYNKEVVGEDPTPGPMEFQSVNDMIEGSVTRARLIRKRQEELL